MNIVRRPRDFVPAAVYLLVTLAWSWPLPLHLTNRFTHDPGDPLLVTYLMWWNAQAVPLTHAWWNAPYYWPMHDALALTEHLAGLSPLTTPLQWLGASPLTAYNITLIASTWWCGLATHALVRRLGGSRAAAYCAGLAFAFAPYRISQLGHLQLYACWWLPLMLLALHAYYDERRARWLVLLGGACGCCASTARSGSGRPSCSSPTHRGDRRARTSAMTDAAIAARWQFAFTIMSEGAMKIGSIAIALIAE